MGQSISFKNIPSITECDKFLKEQKLPHGKQVEGVFIFCTESSDVRKSQKIIAEHFLLIMLR